MPGSRPSSKRPIRDALRRELRHHIVTGEFAPGTILSPAELAKQLRVSATPLREALIELVSDGLLENVPNRGFVVAPLSGREVTDLYTLIWTLEAAALRLRTPSTDLLAELSRVNTRLRNASPTAPHKWIELDARWHELLVSECGNPILLDFLTSLRRRISRYEYAYARHSARLPLSTKQHAAVVSALRAGNTRAALAALESNWRIGPEFLLPWLQRTGTAPDLSAIANRLRTA